MLTQNTHTFAALSQQKKKSVVSYLFCLARGMGMGYFFLFKMNIGRTYCTTTKSNRTQSKMITTLNWC